MEPAFLRSIQSHIYVCQQEQNFWNAIAVSGLADMRKMEGQRGFKNVQNFLKERHVKRWKMRFCKINFVFIIDLKAKKES